jgi:P-type Cu+ transporter
MTLQEKTMTIDPVCGMAVEPGRAAAHAEFQGATYHFCSAQCRMTFQADPRKYTVPGAKPTGCGGCGCHR